MTSLNLRPSELDIVSTVGDDIAIVASVVDDAGAPVDLTGYTLAADVLRNGSSIATFGLSVGGAADNEITLTLSAVQTAAIDNVPGLTWALKAGTRHWIAGDFRLAAPGTPKTGSGTASTVVTVAELTITLTETGGAGGSGAAADITVADTAGNFTGGNVEAVLAELADSIGTTGKHWIPFSFVGDLEVGSGQALVPILADCNVTAYRIRGVTAPTGSSAIFDINRNGTTLFTGGTNRPTVAAAATTSTTTLPAIVALSAGDWVSVDVDQVGSTVPGADFVLLLEVTET